MSLKTAPLAQAQDLNEVTLIGRLSGEPDVRALPSGDEVVSFNLVVRRPPRRGQENARAQYDTIEITSFQPAVIGRSTRWEPGTWLRVEGALRRRFWQSPAGARSRYDVEARTARVAPSGTLQAKPGGARRDSG